MKNWQNISWPWLGIPLLMLGTLAGCSGAQRTLQYESRPSPWKIYYVRIHHLSVGTAYHYEVRFRGQRFAIPKEVLRSPGDIDEFESVTAPETVMHAGDTITLVFSHGVQEASGSISYGGRRVVRAQALDGTKVSLRGLDGRGAAVIELEAGRP
ncbi:hypothetical protein CO670_27685 [Rhizobium sp. J15]|uniref:hypothetical protein n=1 Tax=Rhizobium sp. J15 TaxID=2035450 RepID=UPI000BE9B0FE|nr:hypothetical protein [Rhizobium sp. J15]PDT13125.1 hypothetical protein CO670_27685 [Rhizobium sp. J15]